MSTLCLNLRKYWELHEEWKLFLEEWVNLHNDLTKKSGKVHVRLVVPIVTFL